MKSYAGIVAYNVMLRRPGMSGINTTVWSREVPKYPQVFIQVESDADTLLLRLFSCSWEMPLLLLQLTFPGPFLPLYSGDVLCGSYSFEECALWNESHADIMLHYHLCGILYQWCICKSSHCVTPELLLDRILRISSCYTKEHLLGPPKKKKKRTKKALYSKTPQGIRTYWIICPQTAEFPGLIWNIWSGN